jgi:lipoprotein NlpD
MPVRGQRRMNYPAGSLRSPLALAALAFALLAAGCATRVPAPIEDRSARPPLPPAASVPAPAEIPAPAPEPDWRPQTYTVKRGDTLQAIGLEFGLDYRDLAAWNNVENPNLIRVGQVLRLRPPGDAGANDSAIAAGPDVTTAPLRTPPPVVAGDARAAAPASPPVPRNNENYKSQPKALKEPYSEQALRDVARNANAVPPPVAAAPPPAIAPPTPPATTAGAASVGAAAMGTVAGAAAASPPAAAPAPPVEPVVVARAEPKPDLRPESKAAAADDGGDDKIDWLWPTSGKLVTGFSDTANLKGIDIAGKAGQPIFASAAGKVVYAGTGLRGYGKLVIVKHNNTYLSAYAHNKDLLVKEGQQVTRGQKIAEMGNTDSDEVKLHFEIRKLGKPVDPLKYLPPA